MDRGEIRSVTTTGKELLLRFFFFLNANALEGSKSHGLGRSILLTIMNIVILAVTHAYVYSIIYI